MRCRHFTMRLSPQHAQEDEATLNAFLATVHVHSVQTSLNAVQGGRWHILVFYETGQVLDEAPQKPLAPAEDTPLTPEEQRIYDQLRAWRSERAAEEGKPPYIIAHNAVLKHIARNHMSIQAAEDLAGIKQFGQARTARYGSEIIRVLHELSTAEEEPLFAEAYE